MSKVGKKPIPVPESVQVSVAGGFVSVKGPKGTLTRPLPRQVTVTIADGMVIVTPAGDDKNRNMYWGLARALVQNMVHGVTVGFEKVLEFQGVGYKATVKGSDLELGLGFSHPVLVPGQEGITFKTEKNTIRVEGADKEMVGKIAAKIRGYRQPEPYKGSGIRYQGEVVRRKAGKKAATAA